MSEIGNNILIPTDFSEMSGIAIEQTYNLARLANCNIVLLYVLEEPGLLRSLFSEDDFEQRKNKIQQRLNEIATSVREASGVEVSTMIREGRIYSEILNVAEVMQSKFIVMGTSSDNVEDETGKKMVGANTSRVIRAAPCPVITINSKHHFSGCRNILLPLDLSQETRQKVTWGIEMAKLFNARIKVVSALWSKNNELIYNQLMLQLKQVKNFIDEAGVPCTAELVESTGKEKSLVPIIQRYAREQGDIDLIIVLTQQELGIVEFFISSTAQEMIRTSDIPVMSIIPKELGFISIM